MRFALVTEDAFLTGSLVACFADDVIVIEPFAGELPLLRAMRATAYDLVLIDAKNNSMLVNALLSWRNCNADLSTPIIVLTPFSNWSAMLNWVNAGATDVASRFDLEQIRLRVHVVLQREAQHKDEHVIGQGGYVLRRDLGSVSLDGVEIPMTPREFAMAWLFFSNPGKFLSRAQIASAVWGACEQVAARSIEQHVYKLRRKLGLSEQSTLMLKTVYALGYKLDVTDSVAVDDDRRMAPQRTGTGAEKAVVATVGHAALLHESHCEAQAKTA
jgi:DNA-binding response OmpR family regulator